MNESPTNTTPANEAPIDERTAFLVREDDHLDDVEMLALYIIGCQALEFAFTRSTLNADGPGTGLGFIWQATTKAIYRALPHMGYGNLEEIAARVRRGEIKTD